MAWTHFEFTSGANPYISMTEENRKKVMRIWLREGYEIRENKPGFYTVYDKEV